MRLVIGIGNPGIKYSNTRHNVGFQILDYFCEKNNLKFSPSNSDYWYVESNMNAFHFFLVKPTAYVNNTGFVVKEILDKLELSTNDLLVIYDDVNLEIGEIRIRKSGSDGGHKGIKSMIYQLETDIFSRIRIGVGSPSTPELANYVLSEFSNNELNELKLKLPLIEGLIKHYISGGTNEMLNFYSKQSNINSSNIL